MTEKKLLEAALFMSHKPLKLDDLVKVTSIASKGHLVKSLEELQKDYKEKGTEITNTPEGWHMQVRPEFLNKVAELTPYSDIPEGCKRTLALVLYRDPASQSEIIKIQGNKAYSYIKLLTKKGLIKSEKQGRTKVLKPTRELENYFGQDIETIKHQISQEIESSKEN